uniref:Uncharacterized protein n=1 Tax=Rhizophora mucronata TaxID=61149 RepID=A0A2P2NTU7_RHIMU
MDDFVFAQKTVRQKYDFSWYKNVKKPKKVCHMGQIGKNQEKSFMSNSITLE